MRVYIISDVYPPEPVTSAGSARDIADEMTSRGHDVTVFAPFPNRPTGNLIDGGKRAWKQVEARDGYHIVHSWHTLSKRSTFLSRTAENISFGLTSTWQLKRAPIPDVIYMNTWPIFAQWLNVTSLYGRKVPIICVVHDLYPETFTDMGTISDTNPLVRLMTAIDNQVYQKSNIVTVLNETQKDYLINRRGVPTDKMRVFHDWINASQFQINPSKDGSFRQQHGYSPDQFLAMYVGSLTRMAGLDLYVEAAEILRHREDIHIALVGDGAMRQDIESQIQQRGLTNIRIIYPLKPEDVPQVQSAADVLMLSLLPGAAEHTTPSKMLFYMFSQRPVLASVKADSPAARIIKDAACGYVSQQGDAQELATHIEKMAADRASLPTLGENSRSYAEQHFLKENVLPRVCNLIECVGQSDGSDFIS